MKNNEKIKDLVSIIKSARKCSLLGEYGNSLEKYQEAIKIIKERQEEIVNENEDLKTKWKMTEYNIKSEMLQIKDILQTCLELHNSDFSYSRKQNEGFYFLNENKKIIEKEINDMFNKDKKLYEKNTNNKNTNSYSDLNQYNKSTKKSKSYNNNFNNKYNYNSKKTKTNKSILSQISKTSSNNKNNTPTSNNSYKNNSYFKKSKSLKENIEVKMFNPLEEFYGHKLNDKDIMNINKEQNINGDEKIKNLNNIKNEKIKKIKIVSIDLDKERIISNNKINEEEKVIKDKKDKEKKEEDKLIDNNKDIVEQALENFSKFNLDITDDSF